MRHNYTGWWVNWDQNQLRIQHKHSILQLNPHSICLLLFSYMIITRTKSTGCASVGKQGSKLAPSKSVWIEIIGGNTLTNHSAVNHSNNS